MSTPLEDLRLRVRKMVTLLIDEDWFKAWVWAGIEVLPPVLPQEYTFSLLGAVPYQRGMDAKFAADLARVHHGLMSNHTFASGDHQATYVGPDPIALPYVDPAYLPYPIIHRGPTGYAMNLITFVLGRVTRPGKESPDALLASAQEKEAVVCFMRVRDWMTRNRVPMDRDATICILTEAFIQIAVARLCQAQLSASLRSISADMASNGITSWEMWEHFARMSAPFFHKTLSPLDVRGSTLAVLTGTSDWLTHIYDRYMQVHADRIQILQQTIADAERICATTTPVPSPQWDHVLTEVTTSTAGMMVLHPDFAAEPDFPTDEKPRPKGE